MNKASSASWQSMETVLSFFPENACNEIKEKIPTAQLCIITCLGVLLVFEETF